jgi:hypothetical protein
MADDWLCVERDVAWSIYVRWLAVYGGGLQYVTTGGCTAVMP